MAVRTNPLPPGRYWADIPAKSVPIWQGMVIAYTGVLHVEVTEGTDPVFVIFTTTAPVGWLPQAFGFPNVAGPNVHSQADTTQKPDAGGGLFDGFDFSNSGTLILIGLALLAFKDSK